MCTSFSIYSNHILYGMNFDISDRPIKFSISKKNGSKILFIMQKENEKFYPAFGFNEDGVFANLLMVKPNENGVYRRGKDVVHIMKIFEEVLSNKITVEEVKSIYGNHSIVNVPGFSVHSMISNMDKAIIVEPGKEIKEENINDKSYVVLSNTSITNYENQGEKDNRYKICSKKLEDYEKDISIEKAFETLKSCSQEEGEYPTQLSIVGKPKDKEIYFVVGRNFHKIYRYSFVTDKIELLNGDGYEDYTILKKELLLTKLI